MRNDAPVLVRLESQLDSFLPLLAGASDALLAARPPSGKWSALENLAHLARHHEVFLARIERVLTEDRPRVERYRAEEDAAWPAWAERKPADVLSRLRASRLEVITRLRALSPIELARTGVHSAFGEMTLVQWTEFFLLHEAHHLYMVMGRLADGRAHY